MKIMSWNIRGLNSPRKIKMLSKKIKKSISTLIFLQETKCTSYHIQAVGKKIWKGSDGMGNDERGFVGGMGILWDPNRVTLDGFRGSNCFLSADFKVIGFLVEGVLSNVYGPHSA